MDKVVIRVIETDGLKSVRQAHPTVSSVMQKVRPFLATFKTIYLGECVDGDFEIKQGPTTMRDLPNIIEEFFNEHRKAVPDDSTKSTG